MSAFGYLVRRMSAHRWRLIAALSCFAAAGLAGILLSWTLAWLVRLLASGVRVSGELLPAAALIPGLAFAALAFAEVVLGRIADGMQLRLRPLLRQEVVADLYRHLQRHGHRYFAVHFAGALSQRISEAAQGAAQVIWSGLSELWPVCIVLMMALFLLVGVNSVLALFFAGWALLFVGVSAVLSRRVGPLTRQASEARGHASGRLVDAIANQQSVRLFARHEEELAAFAAVQRDEREIILEANRKTERIRWFQFGAAAALKIGVVAISLGLWNRGAIDLSQFVLASSLAFVVINETRNLGRRLQDLFEAFENLENGLSVILQPHELLDPDPPLEVRFAVPSVRFDKVKFSHDDARPLFVDLNVFIPAGQRIGLVGPSGAGKSTFVNLILRQYDPCSGVVSIDEWDLRTITQDCLHRQIAFVPQDTLLFHRTLAENIRYGDPSANDVVVREAARRADADGFIEASPRGYETLVGERGVKLSGGERQRVALARALLKRAPVLILDEATSSLDSLTEQAIQRALDEPGVTGQTLIVVAHRLSTIAHLDRILVFERGRIVEDGTHEALLALRGTYWRLWTRQSGGFFPDTPDAFGDPRP